MQDNSSEALVRVLTIQNIKGLHARAAAKFVKVVGAYDAEVKVTREKSSCHAQLFGDGEEYWAASGGSVLGILTLGAEKGQPIRVEATGNQAGEVLDALQDLIDRKFDEE